MAAFLLDTNIISALVRQPQGAVFHKLQIHANARICTSIIVAAEIEFGLAKSASERMREQVAKIMPCIEILPLEAPVALHYGQIRAHLHKIGQLIGPNDLLIAAHARALGMVLVTDNLREFNRVPDLQIENWLLELT